jgi:hypothetical protein
MRHKLILAGLLVAVAAPSLALAQPDPNCVRSNQQTSATGTVLGALGGALIGNAIAGRHDRGVGTVGGALAGGVAGNVLAGQHNDPCPDGYYRPAPPPPPAYGPGYGPPPPQGVGFWSSAPQGIHERIDFVQQRINRGASVGRLSPREVRDANHDLNDIRHQEANLRYRDGGHLSPPDRDYLQQRLDTLSQRLHWEAANAY